jgi:hypothetical protein
MTLTLTPPLTLNTVDWHNLIMLYGVASALLALESLEEDGFYEECRTILDTLEEVTATTNEPYPTRLTDEFLFEVAETLNAATDADIDLERAREVYNNHAQLILSMLGYKMEL